MVLNLEVVLTGAISPFAMVQTWFTYARFWIRGSPNGFTAPRAMGRIVKLVANERIELVLMNIIKERQGVGGET